MNHSGFRLSLIVSMLLGVHAMAAAEEVEALENIHVQGVNRSTRTENRDSFTTSAMRTTTGLALSPKETPQSVSVITKTQIEGQGITRLEDALKATTGVTVVRDSDRSRFMSRGFYIDQIEEDGVSSDVSSYVGETILNAESQTDLSVYDHIEVVRGATGLTQANGEPGGTINAVRKRPTSARQIQGSVSAGRFDTYRSELDVSGSLNSSRTVRGRLLGAWEKSGSFIDRVNSRQNVVYGVLDFDLGEKAVWTVAACIKTAMRCRMCTACLQAARIIRCICRAMLIPARRGTTAASPNSIYFRSCGTISTITGGLSAWSIIAATRHFGSMPRSAAVRAGKTAAAPFGAAATALPTTKPRNGRRKAS